MLAARVHGDVLVAVRAAQLAFPAALEAAPPDRLPAAEIVGLVVQLLGRHLAHVADDMAEARPDAVVAVRRGDQVDAAQLAAVRLEDVDLVARDVQLDEVWLELLQLVARRPRALVVLLHPIDVLGRHRQVGGELGHHLVARTGLVVPSAGLVARVGPGLRRTERGREEDVVRGPIVDQGAPVPILDHAPVGGDEERFAEVADRLRAVLVAAQDLQLVQPDDEHQHGADDDQRAERGARTQLADLVGVAAHQPKHRWHQRTRVEPSAGRSALSRRRKTENTAGAAMAVPSALQKSG